MNWKREVTQNYSKISRYNVIGLRGTRPDENYKVGDTARNSYDWDAENDCSSDDELNGTSVVMIDNTFLDDADDLIDRIESDLPDVEQYHGKHIVLLGGWGCEQGTDPGERVIENAKVLAVIK